MFATRIVGLIEYSYNLDGSPLHGLYISESNPADERQVKETISTGHQQLLGICFLGIWVGLIVTFRLTSSLDRKDLAHTLNRRLDG
jgi:hypothetical protein